MKQIISIDLNRRILQLAPKHAVGDAAPSTFQELSANNGQLLVWSGASDNTIYGDPRVNHAFRAWHDSLHLKLGAEFTLEGETRVALEQARQVGSDQLADIILAEIIGQARYFAKHGTFPVDQVAFIVNYMKGGIV